MIFDTDLELAEQEYNNTQLEANTHEWQAIADEWSDNLWDKDDTYSA